MPPVPSKAGQSSRDNNATSDRLSAPTASPPAAPPSRPRSILNVSRSSALSPSLSSNLPLNQLSTSPSSRSIVSNGTARNGVGASSSTALSRLKRVASNASIASSSKFHNSQQGSSTTAAAETQGPAPPAPAPHSPGLTDPAAQLHATSANVSRPASVRSAVMDGAESSGALGARPSEQEGLQPSAAETDTDGTDSINNTITKRPRSPLLSAGDASNGKQARRRTWFGFGGLVDSDGDVNMANASDDGKAKVAQNGDNAARSPKVTAEQATKDQPKKGDPPTKADGDTAMEDANGPSVAASSQQPAPIKGWLPWRGGPSDANQIPPQAPTQASYTDTIRRYVSESSAYNAYWKGWPLWKEETPETKNEGQGVISQGAERQSEQGQTDMTPDDSNTESQKDVVAHGGQASTASRWWPAWGTRPVEEIPAKVEDPEMTAASSPQTPAERVKAEALARIEAKDAVLNNATRSTWINYFSSRSALPTSTVGETDGGPEIMRLNLPPPEQAEGRANLVKGKPAEASKEPQAPLKAAAANGKPDVKKGDKNVHKIDPAPPTSRPSTPLTTDKERAKQVKAAAAAPKGKKGEPANKPSKGPPPPNLLLPSFDDIFMTAPRALPPSKGMLEKTLSYLFSRPSDNTLSTRKRKPSLLSIGASRGGGTTEDHKEHEAQTRLPRLWSVVSDKDRAATKGCKGVAKVTIIGIHGWFSQGPLRNLFGEPTGTSIKFATMMSNAVKEHFMQAGQTLSDEQLSVIALEADGLVADRVNKSFSVLLNNPKWLADILSSNVVCVAAHSQGSVVATHLLARLIEQRHLDPKRTKVVLLAMCGIHHGPFTHLRSSVASYYLNTFETPAAKELFEFQNSKSPVSMVYAAALRIVVNAGVKLVYVASMDDQVVPLYSALNSSASHPSILRAIFCDGAAFPRVDFLTNLLSFCAAVRNAGLSDHNLLTLLSASVAGSLYGGAGHSIVYEEPQVYSLAVRYVMEVTSPNSYPTTKQSEMQPPTLQLEPFSTADNAKWNSNPFALPWSLRGLLEDEVVRRYFDSIIEKLLSDYNEWAPTTKTLKNVQFRLEPMRLVSRQPTPSPSSNAPSTSKL